MMELPTMLAAGFGDYVTWWQIPLVIVLVLLIIFWVWYRRRQM